MWADARTRLLGGHARVPTDGENGFTRLAAYDTAALRGNGDGVISEADEVFSRLRVTSRPEGLLRPLVGGRTIRAARWS